MKKNIVILGGGTAGWLSALLVRRFYQSSEYQVTLVESDEIGILGAGEGTTPHFLETLKTLKINRASVIRECKATIKSGINFYNWNGDKRSYFHGFNTIKSVSHQKFDEHLPNAMFVKSIARNSSLDDINFSRLLADQLKIPYSINKDRTLKTYANTALHFDARLLAKFLRKVAEGRRIKRIEGVLDKVINDKNNNISQLLLMDGSKVDVDFIFDCSGFARLLIGKHFKTEWISYKQSLPLDSAMPFFIEHNNEVAPQTDAIAMKYGWVWKIPVQGRYGCGYVFDSSYINEDEAKQELEAYFGHKIESPKTFKFEAGAYKNALVNNCMAVGLSQGFIEPLEATSIWINNINLTSFLQSDVINTSNPRRQEQFNHECNERNNAVKSFIYLHYLTKRKDSDFWKNFRTKNVMPEDLRVFLGDFLESPFMRGTSALWSSESFFAVMSGLGLFDTKKFETIVDRYGLKYDKSKEMLVNKLEEIAAQCLSHQRFINEALK